MAYIVNTYASGSGKSTYCSRFSFSNFSSHVWAKIHFPQDISSRNKLLSEPTNRVLSYLPWDEKAFNWMKEFDDGLFEKVNDPLDFLKISVALKKFSDWYVFDATTSQRTFYYKHLETGAFAEVPRWLADPNKKAFVNENTILLGTLINESGEECVFFHIEQILVRGAFFLKESFRPRWFERVWIDTESGAIPFQGFQNPKIDEGNADLGQLRTLLKRKFHTVVLRFFEKLGFYDELDKVTTTAFREDPWGSFESEIDDMIKRVKGIKLEAWGASSANSDHQDLKKMLVEMNTLRSLFSQVKTRLSLVSGTVDTENYNVVLFEGESVLAQAMINPLSWQFSLSDGCLLDSLTIFRYAASKNPLPGTIPSELVNEIQAAQANARYLAFWARRSNEKDDSFERIDFTPMTSGYTSVKEASGNFIDDVFVSDRDSGRRYYLPFTIRLVKDQTSDDEDACLLSWRFENDSTSHVLRLVIWNGREFIGTDSEVIMLDADHLFEEKGVSLRGVPIMGSQVVESLSVDDLRTYSYNKQ